MKNLMTTLACGAALFVSAAVQAAPIALDLQASASATMLGNNAGVLDQALIQLNYLPVANTDDIGGSADFPDWQDVVRFDTSALSALAGAGQTVTINSARLQLDYLGQGGSPTDTILRVGLGETDDWDLLSTSSNLWGQYSRELGNRWFGPGTPAGLVEIDLSGLSVQEIGDDGLLSVLLHADENANSLVNQLQFGAGLLGRVPHLLLDVTVSPVPEPGTPALAGLGLATLLLWRRRRA